ncbi:MAG: hypothetical protein RML40_06735, partial [Bacteroidota bacterium]|nr:hypothetical protein [Candidatus Kapabacteria bacterium]MDW8220212.1 hypothetical protein [Bacteroidota bacterium]
MKYDSVAYPFKDIVVNNIDWHGIITAYGLWGVGGASFLSATLLPLSSEAVVLAAIAAGLPAASVFWVCSIANCCACLCNYYCGAALRSMMMPKLSSYRAGRRALLLIKQWGMWGLWLSWLPVIGDPLTIAAGIMRVRVVWFVGIVFTLRCAR